eukprot:7973070-Alexandrium_andersonii.AAC.1
MRATTATDLCIPTDTPSHDTWQQQQQQQHCRPTSIPAPPLPQPRHMAQTIRPNGEAETRRGWLT